MEQRGLGGSETLLYDAVTVDPCRHTFVHSRSTDTTKSEPSCKLRTPGDCDVSVSVRLLYQVPLSGGNVDTGGSCAGQVGRGE